MQIVNICVDVLTEEKEDGGKRLKDGLELLSSGAMDAQFSPWSKLLGSHVSRDVLNHRYKRGWLQTSVTLRQPRPAISIPPPCKDPQCLSS